MPYGQGDLITEAIKERDEAVRILLSVATGDKTVTDIQIWLEENYPDLCIKEKMKRKGVAWVEPREKNECEVHGSIEHMQSLDGTCPGCGKK